MKKLFTLLVIVAISLGMLAQPPQKMSYQCVIRNSGGALVTNQSIGIKISILQGTPPGTVVYQEIYNPNPQTNTNGLISIEIGGGIPITGIFSEINWALGSYFLETEIDPTGGTTYTIVGTSQLLSVPYAFLAKTSETSTDAVTLSGNQTIAGIKAFNNDLLINGLTIGNGEGTISSNTAVGNQALYSNTTGSFNTAIGYASLRANTTGGSNTANGSHALFLNTTGYANSASGYQALYSNSVGGSNTAVGYQALYANTSGSGSTANGYQALYSNTTGISNTANGRQSLYSNTTGTENTANGDFSLRYNTIGKDNTADGYFALNSNTSGNYNTATGSMTLYGNTTGTKNTANGYLSLYYNTTGTENTANGVNTLFHNATGNYNTANGSFALEANTTGNYNTANGSNALINNTTGIKNTANGFQTLYYNSTGGDNTAIGLSAGSVNSSGNQNTFIGSQANVETSNLSNSSAIGYSASVNASNKVRIGNTSVTVIEGQVNWSVGSDSRLKDDIQYSDKLGLEFVNNLKTATFTYKNDSTKRHHDGLIAQDVKNVLDQLGLNFSGLIESDNKERTMNLAYSEFVIPLINAVQEQQKQINELKLLVKSLMQK